MRISDWSSDVCSSDLHPEYLPLLSFKHSSRPANDNRGAAVPVVAEAEPGTAVLQQGRRDEDPQPHVKTDVVLVAAGQIGLSDAVQQDRRKAGAVIGDLQADFGRRPVRADRHLPPGEMDRVL